MSGGSTDVQLRVLLAEDNASNQKVMAAYMDYLGHDATFAGTGTEAFAAATSAEFDVFLIDIQLPDMNGADLVSTLRGTGEELPYMVAVTAMARSDGEDHYRRLGFDAYLPKPVWLNDLREMLEAVTPR